MRSQFHLRRKKNVVRCLHWNAPAQLFRQNIIDFSRLPSAEMYQRTVFCTVIWKHNSYIINFCFFELSFLFVGLKPTVDLLIITISKKIYLNKHICLFLMLKPLTIVNTWTPFEKKREKLQKNIRQHTFSHETVEDIKVFLVHLCLI